MELRIDHTYKWKEIKGLVVKCPFCNNSDKLSYSSNIAGAFIATGFDRITCEHCRLDLKFNFLLADNEIVDEYKIDYCKVGNVEFRNDNQHLSIYHNNVYVKDVDSTVIDLKKIATFIMLE